MKCDKRYMLLYAVTDRAWTGKQTLYQQVEAALKGGVTCVQLREKELDKAAFLQEARDICALWTSLPPAARMGSMWVRRIWKRERSVAGWGRT